MSAPSAGLTRRRAARAFDGLQSLGLIVLLAGLGLSEAAKSIGVALAVLGFAGKLACGVRPGFPNGLTTAILAAFFAAAVLSVVVAKPGFGRPRELLTLAMTIVSFPLIADACRRSSRRVLFAAAIVAGAAAASLAGYAGYMAGPYRRLVLPSIENAVPAAEYLGAVIAFTAALVYVEWRATVMGPLLGFAGSCMAVDLLMTKSRGPALGAVAGLASAIGMSIGRKRLALLVVAALAAAVCLFGVANPGARFVKEGVGGSRTAAIRTFTWRRTVQLFAERPLTGHGPGSYPLLGIVYCDEIGPEHELSAHNIVLHTACETGVLGCGTLVLFLVLGVRDVISSARRHRWRLGRAMSVGSLAGVIALLASGIFSVSTDAEPGILLCALLALGASGEPEAWAGARDTRSDG